MLPRDHFETFGFVKLELLDAASVSALATEFDTVMREAFVPPLVLKSGAAGNQFLYVPTMCEHTPVSLSLIRRLSAVAAELLDAPVLPSRAKATLYRGSTAWHRDGELPVRSVGFAFYLEPLTADDGALAVVPGSHRPEFGAACARYATHANNLPGRPIPTVPGEAIAFDEHLYHASSGGTLRRQWRVDFVADLPGTDDLLRSYFAGQYAAGWDGGYDVARFASYGAHWRTLDAHWNRRLSALGAYAAAEAEETAARDRRLGAPAARIGETE